MWRSRSIYRNATWRLESVSRKFNGLLGYNRYFSGKEGLVNDMHARTLYITKQFLKVVVSYIIEWREY
jgi:hypothetical protein